MDEHEVRHRLSRITTLWTVLFQAHQGTARAASLAQQRLFQRYGGAVYRYLLAALRDPDAAEEVAQDFALRFVRGDFKRADPERGRFRDYLRASLIRAVRDYER